VSGDPFAGVDLEGGILARASRVGLTLTGAAVVAIAGHARAVLETNRELNLTGIDEPDALLDRHVGESLEGAALLGSAPSSAPAVASGDAAPSVPRATLVDLGSGNGYPGLPVAAALGLAPVLVESTGKKAVFLRGVVERWYRDGTVVGRHVDRAADLAEVAAPVVLTTRAMGGWDKVLPRVAPALAPGGSILLWAGPEVETVARRSAWRALDVVGRRVIAGRERSWIWWIRRVSRTSR